MGWFGLICCCSIKQIVYGLVYSLEICGQALVRAWDSLAGFFGGISHRFAVFGVGVVSRQPRRAVRQSGVDVRAS